jgi:hypothetical protein
MNTKQQREMNPKQKAVDLVQRFIDEAYAETTEQLYTPVAKNAALIAVDEMLGLGAMVGSDLSDLFYIYWEEVKQEIHNL